MWRLLLLGILSFININFHNLKDSVWVFNDNNTNNKYSNKKYNNNKCPVEACTMNNNKCWNDMVLNLI